MHTISPLEITFDPSKDAGNRAKHGVSLAEADKLDWASALLWFDTRKDYGEPRQGALAVLVDRVYFVAFVDRVHDRRVVRRIISLRKANQREFDRYVAYLDSTNN